MATRTHSSVSDGFAAKVDIALDGGEPRTITVKEQTVMNRQRASTSPGFCNTSILLLAVCMLLGTGCGTVPTVSQSQGIPAAGVGSAPMITEINNAITAAAGLPAPGSSPDYHLGPDDILQITLFNVPESEAGVTPRTNQVRVSQEGNITLPLLGDIAVTGLTISDVEHSLAERYNRYLHKPQVKVFITEYRSQPVVIMGAVRNPGVQQLTGPKTLIDLLSMAGGITERAGSQVHVYRQGPEGRQSFVIDLFLLANNPGMVNMPVQAGDVINVQQAGMFFVDGAVGHSGSFALNRPYTLTQALAVAGGVNREVASYSEIAIYRQRNGAEAEMIPVDLSAIWEGKASDPRIETDDVIVVPMSTAKYIIRRFFGTIGLGSVSTLGGL
jgi:polysaccharide biosynthesis/export protein